MVHCLDGKGFFSLPYTGVSSWFSHSHDQAKLCNILCCIFHPFQDSRCVLYTAPIPKYTGKNLTSPSTCLHTLRTAFIGLFPLSWWPIGLRSVVMDPSLIHSDVSKNLFGLRLYTSKHDLESATRFSFCSIWRKCGTHFTLSFFICKWSCKIETADPVDMPTVSAISHTFTLRLFQHDLTSDDFWGNHPFWSSDVLRLRCSGDFLNDLV